LRISAREVLLAWRDSPQNSRPATFMLNYVHSKFQTGTFAAPC
jgi:hypothetical protein